MPPAQNQPALGTGVTAILALIAALASHGVGSAAAQDIPTAGETIGHILDATKLRTEPPEGADFVRATRPDKNGIDYRPFAPPGTNGAPTKKTPAQLDAIGAEMEAARAHNKRAAARVAIPDVVAPAKPKARARRGD